MIGVDVSMLALALLAVGNTAPTATSHEDYLRAERFLSWNRDRYVRNADFQPHWIGNEDRFSYLRTNVAGQRECVLVDAASGKRMAASACVETPPSGTNESLSPDGKWAAFLQDYNLWIRPVTAGAAFPLTSDGAKYHGYASSPGYSTHSVSDIRKATAVPPQVLWSPDSRFLLTYRLDERQVKDLHLLQSITDDNSFRPRLYTYRYAMAGDPHLPMLQPIVFDLIAHRQIPLETEPLPCLVMALIEKRDAWWAADSRSLYYLKRDRYSRSVSLNKADALTGEVTQLLVETSATVVQSNADNVFSFPLVRTLGNGDVIWYSQRDGWGHLYYYDRTGALRNQITHGDWAVRDIVRVDPAHGLIYFTASGREHGRDPYELYLYRVRFDGTGMRLLTPERAHHEPPNARQDRFSPSGKYFLDSYSRPDLPPVLVLRAADGRLVQRLEEADIAKLREGGYTLIEPFEVRAADGLTRIYGNLFRPSTFNSSRMYPVIDSVYPGPQTTRTRKGFMAATFDTFEAQSLAELGFIVVTIDGRGTPHRSKAFQDYSYGRLEKASELKDHIAGIRQLAQRYPYMDLDRVGVDGASAGGYAAAHAILAYPDFYKVAVSAAGTHDPRAYLAPWGEIFIGPPAQSDYASSSTAPLAGHLKGKLLLMHGELDENVPPASTMRLVDALIKANKDFDFLFIPGDDHGAARNSRYFIRRKWDYFVRNLLGAEPPANASISTP